MQRILCPLCAVTFDDEEDLTEHLYDAYSARQLSVCLSDLAEWVDVEDDE